MPSTSPVTEDNAEKRISFLAEPSSYRNVDRIAKEVHGRLEVMRQVVTEEGDFEVNLEEEVKHVQQMKEESKQTVESDSDMNHCIRRACITTWPFRK